MCLCDNIGPVALILLGWELRASYITVQCVQAVMILSPLLFMPSLYSHSNLKNFYITCTILGIRMHSGPRAKSMHLRRSCVRICQLTTFLIVTRTSIRRRHRSNEVKSHCICLIYGTLLAFSYLCSNCEA